MATVFANSAQGSSWASDQKFFVRIAWVLAGIIVIGFAQHAAMGRVDIPAVPVWVHLHGIAMIAWLALFVGQSRLAASGNLALHRRLGWLGAFLACVIVGLGSFSGMMAIALGRTPPFFSDAYFLALTQIGVVVFGGLALSGVVNRRDTQTHRRLMIGSTILILEPAFGRILPMPIIGGEVGEWIIMVIQLGFVGAIALHDRKVLGRVHAATASLALVTVLAHVLVTFASHSAPVIALAAQLSAR